MTKKLVKTLLVALCIALIAPNTAFASQSPQENAKKLIIQVEEEQAPQQGAKPQYNNSGQSQPMSAEQISKALPKFLEGDVTVESRRKAFGWASRIRDNPILDKPQKYGFLSQIDCRFGTSYSSHFNLSEQKQPESSSDSNWEPVYM